MNIKKYISNTCFPQLDNFLTYLVEKIQLKQQEFFRCLDDWSILLARLCHLSSKKFNKLKQRKSGGCKELTKNQNRRQDSLKSIPTETYTANKDQIQWNECICGFGSTGPKRLPYCYLTCISAQLRYPGYPFWDIWIHNRFVEVYEFWRVAVLNSNGGYLSGNRRV